MAKSKSSKENGSSATIGFEAKLTTLRDTLLPKLLSGELSVAGAERKVTA